MAPDLLGYYALTFLVVYLVMRWFSRQVAGKHVLDRFIITLSAGAVWGIGSSLICHFTGWILFMGLVQGLLTGLAALAVTEASEVLSTWIGRRGRCLAGV